MLEKPEDKKATGREVARSQAGTRTPPSKSDLRAQSKMKKELKAYSSLKAKGVSDQAILRWERTMAKSGLGPGAVQRELSKSASLSKLEERALARVEKARLALESIRAKNEELRKKYSAAWDSITMYQLLREMGVDGRVLQRWERLVVGNGLNPEKMEDELIEHKNLIATRTELEGKLAEMQAKLDAAEGRLRAAEGELEKLEFQRGEMLKSVDDIAQHFKDNLRVMTDEAAVELERARVGAGEEIQKASADARSNLNASLASATSAVDEFKAKIEATYESALQTGEAIGRTEALKPLVKFLETGEGKPGEIIPLMTILAHTFAKWAEGNDPALAGEAREFGEYLNGKLRGA